MGNIGLGVLYLFFCWTFIPVLVSLVELFVARDGSTAITPIRLG